MFDLFRQQINDINIRIAELDATLNASDKANPVSQRLTFELSHGPRPRSHGVTNYGDFRTASAVTRRPNDPCRGLGHHATRRAAF